jgi:hypothetical protein
VPCDLFKPYLIATLEARDAVLIQAARGSMPEMIK